MNETFRKIIDKAADSKAVAESLKDQGITYLTATLDKLPLLQSIAVFSNEASENDETHYLLIPNPNSEKGYTVFTKRVIPAGHGANNSLPKSRIFHIPDPATQEILIESLVDEKVKSSPGNTGSEFADRLDVLADQIDEEAMKVSGGLLLIGGAVCFLNPLVGIGIALNALIPSIGSKAAKAGTDVVGDKLRKWSDVANLNRSRKKAEGKVKKLKPEIYINPLLETLDAILTNESADFDPFLDSGNLAEKFEQIRCFTITLEGINAVYHEVEKKKHSFDLNATQENWIRHLLDLHKAI